MVRAQVHEAEDNGPKVLHVVDIAEHQDIHHGEDGEQSCRGGESTDTLQAVGIEMVPLVRPGGRCSEGYTVLLVRSPILAKHKSCDVSTSASWVIPKGIEVFGTFSASHGVKTLQKKVRNEHLVIGQPNEHRPSEFLPGWVLFLFRLVDRVSSPFPL